MATILFIDDDPDMPEKIAYWLELYGHQVERVCSAAEGFERLEGKDYQLTVCGLLLEDDEYPTGFELALALRAKLPAYDRMTIVLTAPEDLGTAAWAVLRRHEIYFLSKYLSLEQWAKKIQALLEAAQQLNNPETEEPKKPPFLNEVSS